MAEVVEKEVAFGGRVLQYVLQGDGLGRKSRPDE